MDCIHRIIFINRHTTLGVTVEDGVRCQLRSNFILFKDISPYVPYELSETIALFSRTPLFSHALDTRTQKIKAETCCLSEILR